MGRWSVDSVPVVAGRSPSVFDVMRDGYGIRGRRTTTTTFARPLAGRNREPSRAERTDVFVGKNPTTRSVIRPSTAPSRLGLEVEDAPGEREAHERRRRQPPTGSAGTTTMHWLRWRAPRDAGAARITSGCGTYREAPPRPRAEGPAIVSPAKPRPESCRKQIRLPRWHR
jgi:hypothetical protein